MNSNIKLLLNQEQILYIKEVLKKDVTIIDGYCMFNKKEIEDIKNLLFDELKYFEGLIKNIEDQGLHLEFEDITIEQEYNKYWNELDWIYNLGKILNGEIN